MNIFEADILRLLSNGKYSSQRLLAESSGYSLGVINKSLKNLFNEGYLDSGNNLTEKARKEIAEKSPKNAVILAAGFGMRMVTINTLSPKAFIKVHGEVLTERIIKQLHKVGIKEIYVVVGYMK